MNKQMKNIMELAQWQTLRAQQAAIKNQHMRAWFNQDPERFKHFSLKEHNLLLDFSRNRINEQILAGLVDLAYATQLDEKINALFNGEAINATENRPALHTALRAESKQPIYVKGKNIQPAILAMREQMEELSNAIEDGRFLGVTGKPIESVVNIGIGGSHLGPMMACHALKNVAKSRLKFHFVSSVDKSDLQEVLTEVDPETTLFIVSSKSFTTIETLTNAQTALAWMQNHLGLAALTKHFIAITANPAKARAFGIPDQHILPLWEWVGGRYSIWSAIGLPLRLMLKRTQYQAFLHGAYLIDEHFRNEPFQKNMPILLALLGIWYMNFFATHVQAIVPYSHRLRFLVPYLQQAEMESNGKSIRLNGEAADYTTSPIIFGEEGCNGQHAYHQLLLQGQHLIPVDFILIANSSDQDHHQDVLVASGISQAQALMRGKTYEEALDELLQKGLSQAEAFKLAPHRMIPGNRPSNILFLKALTPQALGSLIALYEHKIFVQGAIWDINSFDQWGVELGKQLLPDILRSIKHDFSQANDPATLGNIHFYKEALRKP